MPYLTGGADRHPLSEICMMRISASKNYDVFRAAKTRASQR